MYMLKQKNKSFPLLFLLIKQGFTRWLSTFSTRFSTFLVENVDYTKRIKQFTQFCAKNKEKQQKTVCF